MLAFANGGGDGAGVGHFFDHAVEVRVVRGAKLAVGDAENTPETGEFHCGEGAKGGSEEVKMVGGGGGEEVVEGGRGMRWLRWVPILWMALA